MASNTQPAVTWRDIQGASLDLLQERNADMLVKAKLQRFSKTQWAHIGVVQV